MSHYLNDEYIDRVFAALRIAHNDEYYYKMAAAWCTATAMAKYRDKTYRFLETCCFDDWTYNKSIQKMLESRRVSDEDKQRLRAMKRKWKTAGRILTNTLHNFFIHIIMNKHLSNL